MTRAYALVFVGAVLTVAGVGLLSVPAGLVVAGVILVGAGLLIDLEE